MHHIFTRIPTHFYRISLLSKDDAMTLALVPDQEHAHLIASLLTENYKLRQGEKIIVALSPVRPDGRTTTTQLEPEPAIKL